MNRVQTGAFSIDQHRPLPMHRDSRGLPPTPPPGRAPAGDAAEATCAWLHVREPAGPAACFELPPLPLPRPPQPAPSIQLGEPAGLDASFELPPFPLERAPKHVQVIRQGEVVAGAMLDGGRGDPMIQ